LRTEKGIKNDVNAAVITFGIYNYDIIKTGKTA